MLREEKVYVECENCNKQVLIVLPNWDEPTPTCPNCGMPVCERCQNNEDSSLVLDLLPPQRDNEEALCEQSTTPQPHQVSECWNPAQDEEVRELSMVREGQDSRAGDIRMNIWVGNMPEGVMKDDKIYTCGCIERDGKLWHRAEHWAPILHPNELCPFHKENEQ